MPETVIDAGVYPRATPGRLIVRDTGSRTVTYIKGGWIKLYWSGHGRTQVRVIQVNRSRAHQEMRKLHAIGA